MKQFDQLINHEDYELELGGITIKVVDGVFTPDSTKTNSSSLILNNLPEIKGKDVIDMGTGSGIIAIACSKKGAKNIIGVDIHKHSLSNAQYNIEKNKIHNIQLIESNLFENVKGSFDYIFANLPIDDNLWNLKETTTHMIQRFLQEAKAHLNQDGKIYLTWCSLVDVQPIKEAIHDNHYSFKEIIEHKFNLTWYLFIIS